mgnify:CR=1 FL=1
MLCLLSVEVPDPDRFCQGALLFRSYLSPDLDTHFMQLRFSSGEGGDENSDGRIRSRRFVPYIEDLSIRRQFHIQGVARHPRVSTDRLSQRDFPRLGGDQCF